MTITLQLPAEIEADLIREARAKGVPIAEVVKAHLIRSHTATPALPTMTSEELERALDELFDSIPAPAGVQEGAFHRENWYR